MFINYCKSIQKNRSHVLGTYQRRVTSCTRSETTIHRTSLFSHVSAYFICKARHLENVETGAEKRDWMRTQENICEGEEKSRETPQMRKYFPSNTLSVSWEQKGEAMTSRLPQHALRNAIYSIRTEQTFFCHLLWRFISPFCYIIIP